MELRFDPSHRSPGDNDPTAINETILVECKGGEGLDSFGKPLDRPAQLCRTRGFPLYSRKDKMGSRRS